MEIAAASDNILVLQQTNGVKQMKGGIRLFIQP